jgi:GR25 family glycosyltransferase involved in LPS biosynthesis
MTEHIKKMDDYFDAVYYINLKHRVDRREAFEATAHYLQIKNVIRFEAINGHELDSSSWPGKQGALGVRESHIRLLENAKEKKHKRFMVFEDDAIIEKSFSKQLLKLTNETGDDWDMLYLYAKNHYKKPIPVKKGILRLQNTLGLVAVAYNSRNLSLIIEKLKNDYRWVDSCMADLHTELKVYAPTKSIVNHAKGFSDNEDMYTYTDKSQLLLFWEKIIRRTKRMFNNTLSN